MLSSTIILHTEYVCVCVCVCVYVCVCVCVYVCVHAHPCCSVAQTGSDGRTAFRNLSCLSRRREPFLVTVTRGTPFCRVQVFIMAVRFKCSPANRYCGKNGQSRFDFCTCDSVVTLLLNFGHLELVVEQLIQKNTNLVFQDFCGDSALIHLGF